MNARREAKYRKYIRPLETPTRKVVVSGIYIALGLLGFCVALGETVGLGSRFRMKIQRVDDAYMLEGHHSISTFVREFFKDHFLLVAYQSVREKLKKE